VEAACRSDLKADEAVEFIYIYIYIEWIIFLLEINGPKYLVDVNVVILTQKRQQVTARIQKKKKKKKKKD
jgi:hypothetical protein